MATKTFSYAGPEKLKSRKLLNQVFAEGKSFNAFPLKITFTSKEVEGDSIAKIGVGVSSRHFKKAVDRNRVKRLIRESYRLQKNVLIKALPEKTQVHVFILFVGKELGETSMIPEKMKLILEKLGNSFQNKF
jgi:ribonuclease P protein component